MAYSIKLYQTASDKRTVNKALTSVMDTSGEIWGDCDLLSPSLILNVVPGVNFNYLQILDAPFNGRYYFVDNISIMQNGIMRVPCNIDVLMSHKTDIKKETAILARQTNLANLYFNDPDLPIENRNAVIFKQFLEGRPNKGNLVIIKNYIAIFVKKSTIISN